MPLNFACAQAPAVESTQTVASDPATDADFYLDKADVKVAELQAFAKSLQSKTDLRQYPFRPVYFSKRDIDQTRRTLDLAKAQIELLSDDANADRLQRYRRLSRRTERLSNYLMRIRTNLLALLNPNSFPDLKTDADRLRGIGMMLANIDSFESDPQLAATIVKQLPAAQEEAKRITAKYDLLIRQETIAGLQLVGLKRYFDSKRKSFEAIVKQQQQVLPERIKDNLGLAKETLGPKRASPGGRDKSEIWVTLNRRLRAIQADVKLLETIKPNASAIFFSQLDQIINLRIVVKKLKPADLYVGDDRDDLVKAILLSGVKPDSDRLRIPDKNWKRQTFWRFNSGQWQKIDRSVLEVYVFAKIPDDSILNWHRFVMTKDHLNKDSISARREE